MVLSLVSAPRRASLCSHPWQQKMYIGCSLCIEGKTCWYISDLHQEREARRLRWVKSEERIVIVLWGPGQFIYPISIALIVWTIPLSLPSLVLYYSQSWPHHLLNRSLYCRMVPKTLGLPHRLLVVLVHWGVWGSNQGCCSCLRSVAVVRVCFPSTIHLSSRAFSKQSNGSQLISVAGYPFYLIRNWSFP